MKRRKNYCIVAKMLALLFIMLASGLAFAQTAFVIGEDVLHPSGLVLTVNSISRNEFKSGFGSQGKQDEIFINLTLVNTGSKTFRVDPLQDFVLELTQRFQPQGDKDGRATKEPFNVFPATQSRVDLYFRVDSAQKAVPVLSFSLQDSYVRIFCDPELEKLMQKSEEASLPGDEAVRLAQIFIDSGRFAAAEKIVRAALELEPGHTRLLMQMASIEDANYNRESAAACLRQINTASITTVEEAYAVARMAVSLGFYSLAVAVLEPLETVGRLTNEQKVLLARAYYYEDQTDAAARIIVPVIDSGQADAIAYFTYANLLDKQGELDRAIENWQRAVELSPDYAEAHFNLGVGYFKMQRTEKARECWEKVLLLKPDSETLRAAEDALKATGF